MKPAVANAMSSPVVKRSVVVAGHKTSVTLEDAFWQGLKEIAHERRTTLANLTSTIDTDRRHGNLSSAIRLFVLDHYRARIRHGPTHRSQNSTRTSQASASVLLTDC
jgi:predicted DNA-binding ribbon-helix-helix protein